ncbi:MAG: hypothetical protein ABJL44_07975 [Algibacter sp.]
MIKKLVLVFVTIFTLQSNAQENTASPYSFYGIGSLKFKGTVENRSMGGVSIYTDSIHVNLRNPASYAGNNLELWGNESRPVKFTVGGSHSSIDLKSDTSEGSTSSTSFDYLAMNVPMGRFGFGFSLVPYTAVGYKLEDINDNGDIASRFNGEGGVNKASIGFGYQVSKALSVGIDANYNFGNIENSAITYRYDSDDIRLLNQSKESNRSDLSGLNINLGVSYKAMLTEKLEFVSGITFTPESTLVSKNIRDLSTVVVSDSGSESVVNSISVDLEALNLDETDLTIPSKFSFGAGIGAPRKWFVGAEYTTQKISEFSNPLYTNATTAYEDASTISIGGFYIPQYNSYTSYLKRVVYRAGIRQEKSGLNINGESINEFGMSFGVGIPLSGGISNANLGFEIGKRGTTNSSLIQENFINLHISLSLNDRWFEKKKYY